MRFVQYSAAKLNLSFRVTRRREDGYHHIVSLFLRLPGVETLSISKAEKGNEEGDSVRVQGAEVEGENIVSRALRYARDAGCRVPFLDVEIVKNLYPGSGLGAGSGNGAAILRWLAGEVEKVPEKEATHLWRNVALKTGADVPFLFSGLPLALVSGVGEILEPLDPMRLHAVVVFPAWSVKTGSAYERLDHWYRGDYPLSETAARSEAEELCAKLRNGERVGLLPNDFAAELMDKFPDYGTLFGVLEKIGAYAWGITGSGGAAFAILRESPSVFAVEWPLGTKQVLSLDV
ncbi:MAG: 4-diphosphocytidyl-2C-methyl-D-erythritol kinase [Synergistaceae bacterium]|nr:4-diphosphocytidyl-2C-methyl-D-erythritol kinase [Synergistaceae bacterium]